jgi:hypothetical protein
MPGPRPTGGAYKLGRAGVIRSAFYLLCLVIPVLLEDVMDELAEWMDPTRVALIAAVLGFVGLLAAGM